MIWYCLLNDKIVNLDQVRLVYLTNLEHLNRVFFYRHKEADLHRRN
jgi:hypothetical protein